MYTVCEVRCNKTAVIYACVVRVTFKAKTAETFNQKSSI